MTEASRCLALSETGARKQIKAPKAKNHSSRFPAGLEWEIINADAVVLLGLTHALRYVLQFKKMIPDELNVEQRNLHGLLAMHVLAEQVCALHFLPCVPPNLSCSAHSKFTK